MYIKKILLGIVLVGLIVAAYFANFVYSAMFKPNTKFNNTEAYIYISKTDDYEDVRLQLEPLLKDIESFDALANRKKYVSNVKSGRYLIKKGMTNNDIINSIRINNLPIKLSFNNQESLSKLAERISQQIDADSLSLIKAMTNSDFLKEHKFTKQTALGMYIPNSYQMYWDSSADVFVNKMYDEYNSFWSKGRLAKAKELNLTTNEVMALASIVHEESKQASEQPRIAGVYVNRLKIGMPLQADPTLKFAAYQLPKYQNTVIKRVLNEHKTIDSPYNTYMYKGLPPGPIAMPDITAIDAVLNYEHHKYYYFAADAKNIGFHKFAKTLSQHNANAREYHRYLSSQGINR
ncbi:MAG: aminodeoxychorismate lyase [Bacteroidetes bacterium MedPE-SWsnd-G2]|nr:MAG: aminodeoxychorismate lyase [Bacteroidetes bacterium MedPE-SWsnd-G2]